jgi:hypothetical protein
MNFVNVFLIFCVKLCVMKHIALFFVLILAACGHPEHKTPMFFGLFGPQEWPEEHWEGQNYTPTIVTPSEHRHKLPAAGQRDQSLFSDMAGVSPEEFIQNLKDAGIITRVYDEKKGTVERKSTGTVIIEVAPNFYALSDTDQGVMAELLARSYRKDTYVLKDSRHQRVIGQITPSGLNLY